jgi:hypothetical protein
VTRRREVALDDITGSETGSDEVSHGCRLAISWGRSSPVAMIPSCTCRRPRSWRAGLAAEHGTPRGVEHRGVPGPRSKLSWWGRQGHTVCHEAVTSRWRDHDEIDWLLTSARIVGRAPARVELISIWWAGLSGVQVDLDAEVVSFDAANGWRALITGPGVAPIAVAAVAACHGPAALAGHPGFACLRDRASVPGAPLGPEPPALGPGEPVLRLWSSRPSE